MQIAALGLQVLRRQPSKVQDCQAPDKAVPTPLRSASRDFGGRSTHIPQFLLSLRILKVVILTIHTKISRSSYTPPPSCPCTMSDPISFVASVIAIATLAGNVAAKGHRYLKAVKDCPDDVRLLMAEVNVLCSILGGLATLLKGKRLSNATSATESGAINDFEDASDDDTEVDASSASEDEANASSTTLETPIYIYECQRTLEEIQSILHRFAHLGIQSLGQPRRISRFSISALRRLEPKDLIWPLSKSKTLQLLQKLERHKTTCIMALAESGMTSIHNVLMESKLSNRCLADIRAKQDKMLELQLSQEEGQSSLAALTLRESLPTLFFIHLDS